MDDGFFRVEQPGGRMNDLFIKMFLRWGLVLAMIWMSGCAATNQITPIPTTDPTVAATIIVPPSPTVSLATSVPEMTPTPAVPPTQPNETVVAGQAAFVHENYPDNSVLKPGEKFVKTFEIKNAGNIPWTTAYSFVLDPAHQNETLDSPAQIYLPQETPPGNNVSLSIPLTAPTTPGTYTVYWTLKNEQGGTILIDGGQQVWVKIIVCDPNQPCNPPVAGGGTSVTVNGVTITLTGFSSDSSSSTVDFCIMTIPNLPSPNDMREYGSVPAPSLLIDQTPAPFITGSSDFSKGLGCYEMEYQVGAAQIEQAHHVALSIDDIRMMGGPIGDPNVACEAARTKLRQQYPGLDFQCHFSMAGYYTNLQLPTGMTETQAQKIIFDTIEGAIYGPWVLNIKG